MPDARDLEFERADRAPTLDEVLDVERSGGEARLAVEAALASYRVNRVDFLTLLDSQMAVFNYEISRAQAAAGFHKGLAEIDLLTGEPSRQALGSKQERSRQ